MHEKFKIFWQDYCLRLTALQIFMLFAFLLIIGEEPFIFYLSGESAEKTKIQPNLNNPMASIGPFNRYSVLLFLCFI